MSYFRGNPILLPGMMLVVSRLLAVICHEQFAPINQLFPTIAAVHDNK
jgi:hypothetical protein